MFKWPCLGAQHSRASFAQELIWDSGNAKFCGQCNFPVISRPTEQRNIGAETNISPRGHAQNRTFLHNALHCTALQQPRRSNIKLEMSGGTRTRTENIFLKCDKTDQ
jgi:hypothetical protein